MFIFYLAFVSFAPYSLGFLSSFLGEFNLFLFGEFSKYYPFLLLFFNYIFYKKAYDLDNVKKRELNGFIVAFASLMILFAILSLNAGYIPEVLYTIVGVLFGRLGSGLLALAFLIFACVLLFPRFFELVFGVKISFSAFEKLDLAFSSFLEKVFGGKEKSEKQEEILEEDKKESVKEHENNIDESLNLKHIQEVKQELEELSKEESLNETENIEEKTEPAELEKDESLLSYNQELRDFVLKASAEPDELEQSIVTHKQEVYVPQKFLKPKKIDEIKLNLAKRLNYEEPSYTRKKSEFKDETVKESKEEQKEPVKQEPSLELEFEVQEKVTQKADVLKDEFIPVVEELTKEEKILEKTEPLPFVEEVKEALKDENLYSEKEFKAQDELETKTKNIIKTELSSNTELLNELEKGVLAKPKDFSLPPLDFLANPPSTSFEINEQEIDRKIYDLLEKLRRFKIGGDVISTYTGPVVTTFEFRPSADVKVSRILNLQDDLAMALKATSIRIQAPIPGKDVVGIEVPNEQIQTIYLKEILQSKAFSTAKSPLTMALGKDIVGNAFVTDLKKLPHLLIAGTTGSGKSVGINSMLLSLLYRNSPKNLKLMMIDPKMLEFSIYNDIPHLLTPVITEPKKAITALSNMVAEMERRYKLMAEAKTKNIENYNEKMKELGLEELPFIVVIIDELADLMMSAGKDVEFYIARLAQMARASGIHLIVATQRPSVDVVTGLIKANLPSRLAYKVGQKIDSKVILDTVGAESLLGRGDCLFTPPSSNNLVRLHAPFASEGEIEKIVEFLKAQQEVVYDENFLKDSQNSNSSTENMQSLGETDELFEEAKAVILEDRKTSISYLQRRLKIGYNRAANIIEQLSETGFLSQPDSKGQREIL